METDVNHSPLPTVHRTSAELSMWKGMTLKYLLSTLKSKTGLSPLSFFSTRMYVE